MKDKIQDFIQNITIGSKVILDQEYGVLTNCKEHESSTIILWDTPDEKDFEDWSGLWESFVTMGGAIAHPDFQFKYINGDGTLKK
ncbi:hypothetical protein H3Z85_02590 [Chryseobacterium indologenes]|uniref:hypothetical protein n=1 Tax=Chryseobacterium indologenes TaxID=253 RepID=UPI0003E080D9|nr:hypothetical protein [Chryseobacterium indologenes]QPQ52396.1 hypothetical protein H3Z85_02590 [Chryseobacterium indologenes]GAE64735.1 hypothetical protein CIN01S_09_02200 [Chryseobacterium indologenes NBRC 14944]SFJ86068.1 hypothetical protein SAMN05421692_2759 [Chryseobacterium indologenes]SUX51036.1 Uncharacterised protein [Chryseobacterium indologenes]